MYEYRFTSYVLNSGIGNSICGFSKLTNHDEQGKHSITSPLSKRNF